MLTVDQVDSLIRTGDMAAVELVAAQAKLLSVMQQIANERGFLKPFDTEDAFAWFLAEARKRLEDS